MYNMLFFMKAINFSYGRHINKKDWNFFISYGMISNRKTKSHGRTTSIRHSCFQIYFTEGG